MAPAADLFIGLLAIPGVYVSCHVAYWMLLVAARYLCPAPVAARGAQTTRFAILVPAHDEELLLPRLLASIQEQDYPPERRKTIVVADNCTDRTAEVARRHGALVLERVDDLRRGKGYAIRHALEAVSLAQYDAVLVVDADCFLGGNALRSLDGALQAHSVIQCYSGIGNPEESWFTRLLDVSRTLNNEIYSSAKQRLGLSTLLIGTGMCFSARTLERFGWEAFTVGEDCEYYAHLVGQGETVGFAGHARVYHQESSSLGQATSQRLRWSSGKFAVASRFGFGLLRRGMIERDIVKFDAGLTLVLPNPSLGMNLTLLCLAAAMVAAPHTGVALAAWFLCLALLQFGIFVLGVFYTSHKLEKFLAILLAPAFLAWKLAIDALSLLGFGGKRWVRTGRKL